MRRFIEVSAAHAKTILRDKSFMFWSFIYPILMITFFQLAFSGLINRKMEPIKTGIEVNSPYKSVLSQIEVLQLEEMDRTVAEAALKEKKITGWVSAEGKLVVAGSEMQQTVLKEVLDHVQQVNAMELPFEKFRFDLEYVKKQPQKANPMSLPFYSMLGMVSLYGMFGTLEFTRMFQANLSSTAARINTSPLQRGRMLFSAFAVAMLLNFAVNLLTIGYMQWVAKLNLFADLPRSTAIVLGANLVGVALGTLIGSIGSLNMDTKTGLCIGSSIFLSMMAGMMNPEVRNHIANTAPLLQKLNPVANLTDNLYRLNLLGDTRSFWPGLGVFAAQTLCLLLVAAIFMRRKQYDSL